MTTTVVTGAASGIGAAVAAALKDAGHRVIGVDRQQADIVADLSTGEGRQAALKAVIEACGGTLDGLVCCAGVGPTVPPAVIVGVNYFGMSELVDGLVPALSSSSEQPAVLLIGSVASVHGELDKLPMVAAMLANEEQQALAHAAALGEAQAAYAASKYAIAVYARRKALELGPKGIRINVVAPGAVETPLYAASLADPRYGEATRNFVAPLGRAGKPEEIASVVRFLQSEQASFVHGTVVFVDGGMDAMTRSGRF